MTTSGVSHSKVSAASDGGDSSLVRPSDWNDDHVISYVKPVGLTGATAASRYVGATASGAPASGTFAVGDFVIDQTGKVHICTSAGSPGTWVAPASAPTTYGILLRIAAASGNLTPVYEAAGSGTVSASWIVGGWTGAVFFNVWKNQSRIQQITVNGNGAQAITPFSVVAGDQVALTWSTGGGCNSSGGTISCTAGFLNIGPYYGPLV